MHSTEVAEKIQLLPEPLLRQVEDYVDFLLARYQIDNVLEDDYPAVLMTQLAATGGAFTWLEDPSEDIYSDEDGVAP